MPAARSAAVNFFISAASRSWSGGKPERMVAPDSVVGFLRALVGATLSQDAAETIADGGLAFITQTGLIYPDSPVAANDLSRGNTTILHNLERRNAELLRIAEQLRGPQHRRVSFSAYASDELSTSLRMHVDTWDNIVVQLVGCKTFSFEQYADETLNSGDVLTIPQDVAHRVTTHGQSLHLSTVMLRTEAAQSVGSVSQQHRD
jgi:hypothetical protein